MPGTDGWPRPGASASESHDRGRGGHGHQDGEWVARAAQAGASAFIPKGGSLAEMITCWRPRSRADERGPVGPAGQPRPFRCRGGRHRS